MTDITPKPKKETIFFCKTFRDFIESFPDPIFCYDEDDIFVYINKAYCEFYNVQKANIVGKHIRELYPQEIAERFLKHNISVRTLGKSYFDETPVVNSKGDIVTTSAFLYPIKNQDQKKVVGIIGVARNISEQRKLEKSNSDQANNILFMNEILQNAPNMIFFTDLNNVLQYANKNFADFLEKNSEEIIGKKIDELLDESLLETVFKINDEILTNKNQKTYEHDVVINGERLVSEVTKTPFFNKEGETIGIIGIAANRTQERVLEEKLIESQRLESLSILAGGFAHDFNNILAGIRGYSDMLLFQETAEAKIQFLQKINSSIERASELTKKLLEIGKQGTNEIKSVNINDIVSEVINIVRFSTTKDVSFKEDLEPEIFKFKADSGQIFQLIMNLIINSLDAIETEGKIEIITKNSEILKDNNVKEYFLALKIRDNGKGIEKSLQSKIFDPFFSTKMRYNSNSGSGLGLTTVYRIVKNHNGEIKLESTIGTGTSFTVIFPIEIPDKFIPQMKSS